MKVSRLPYHLALASIAVILVNMAAPAEAAIRFGTITFDAAGTAHQQPPGPFFETSAEVDMTLTTDNHLHLGDRSGDGNPDLYNHNGITQTLTFSQPVSILSIDVVDDAGGFGAINNEFKSSIDGTFSTTDGIFSIDALGVFDVAANGSGVWEDIIAFSWLQIGGEFSIDNVQFSAVPIPAALWLSASALMALVGWGRCQRGSIC